MRGFSCLCFNFGAIVATFIRKSAEWKLLDESRRQRTRQREEESEIGTKQEYTTNHTYHQIRRSHMRLIYFVSSTTYKAFHSKWCCCTICYLLIFHQNHIQFPFGNPSNCNVFNWITQFHVFISSSSFVVVLVAFVQIYIYESTRMRVRVFLDSRVCVYLFGRLTVRSK